MRDRQREKLETEAGNPEQTEAGNPLSGMSLEELWRLFPIFLTEHRPVWAQWYQEEKERLCRLLPMEDICEISHVGRTSIPAIWAKPSVDILVEISKDGDMQAMKEQITCCGYTCMMEKAGRISFNRGYTPSGFAERVFHLHLRTAGDNDELYFRDYLREHTEAAREYEALKLGLWKEYEHDRDGYTEHKAAMVARFTGEAKRLYPGRYERPMLRFMRAETGETEELRRLARESEAHWGYDEAFMETFDARFNITDSFIRSNPVFAAREGGCPAAFWGIRQDGYEWELEYFYVAEGKMGSGLGKRMWKHMTGWCARQGIGRIHFVTSPQAAGFYRKMGAVQDRETRSIVDGRLIPHLVYDV